MAAQADSDHRGIPANPLKNEKGAAFSRPLASRAIGRGVIVATSNW